jgi:hypothetical protein
VDEFYNQFLCNAGNNSLEQHYRDKGELHITATEWQPSEDTYDQERVIESKTIDYEVQLKNNPFVKKVPTLRTIRVVTKTPELLRIKLTSKTRQVMYCDSF